MLIDIEAARQRYFSANREELMALYERLRAECEAFNAEPTTDNAIAAIVASANTAGGFPGANEYWKNILVVAFNGLAEKAGII